MAGLDVSSTVELNMQKIEKLTAGAVTALEKTTAILLGDMKNAEVFPFETGNLQNESTFPDYGGSSQGYTEIISSAPYARRLYYHPEYNFNREFNIAAGGEWYEPWVQGGSKDDRANEIFKRVYKEESGL